MLLLISGVDQVVVFYSNNRSLQSILWVTYYKYPQLVSNTSSGRGMRFDEAPIFRAVNGKGAGRPRLMHNHKGWWNETKWMRWVWRNGGMKFVVGENGRNPAKNLPRPRFVCHETHMEWPRRELGTPAVGGEHLTACATRPPLTNYKLFILYIWFSIREF